MGSCAGSLVGTPTRLPAIAIQAAPDTLGNEYLIAKIVIPESHGIQGVERAKPFIARLLPSDALFYKI